MADLHPFYPPGLPGPELGLALGMAALVLGIFLPLLIGWWTLAVVGGLAVLSGGYLLVHRYRYGRWGP